MSALAYSALWIFIFALPWQNIIVIPGLGTISRLMGMIAFALAVLAALFARRIRRWNAFHLSALVFVLWAGLSLYRGDLPRFNDYEPMFSKFKTYAQLFLVLWMIWELAPTPRRQAGLLLAYVLGAYVAAVDTIVVYQQNISTMRRFAAEGFDANDLAMMLALAIPMAWYLSLIYRQRLGQWFCRGFIPIGLLAMLLTGSRGGMLAGIMGLAIIPFTMMRLSPGRIAAAIFLLAGAAVLAVQYVPDTLVQRLATTGSEIQEGGMNGRVRIWEAGVEALTQRPLLGYGTGGFERAVRPILGSDRGAHNTFLAVLVEQGMIGFPLFLLILITACWQVRRLPLLERRFAFILLATLGIAMLPLAWDDYKPVWFILGLLVTIAEFHRSRPAGLPEKPRPVPFFSAPPALRWRSAGASALRREAQ